MTKLGKKIYLCASEEKQLEFESFVSELKESFYLCKLEESEYVIILGGDGTLNYFINKLKDRFDFKIIYFPCGTANDFAKSLTIVPTLPTVKKVIEIINNSQLISIPIMSCNERRFLNVTTGGAPAKVTSSKSNLTKELVGKVSYYISALEEIFSPSIFEIEYSIDSKDTRKIKTYGFVIAQGLYAGGGVKVSASFTPNFQKSFNFLTFESIHLSNCLSSLLKMQTGEEFRLDDTFIINEVVSKIRISSNISIPLKLDGEEYSSSNLEFFKEKEKLQFYIY